MAINKVEFGDDVLMDLTGDTVNENNLLEGETAHDASGNRIIGKAKTGSSEWGGINDKPFETVGDDFDTTDGELKLSSNIKNDVSNAKDTLDLSVEESDVSDSDNYLFEKEGKIRKKSLSKLWNWISLKLHKVATSGSYNDLSNKPTIPDVSGKLNIRENGNWGINGNGQYSYCRIARLKPQGAYCNRPVMFEVSGRGFSITHLNFIFQNSSGTDPGIGGFTTDGRNAFWVVKAGTSTWDLYGQYTESWGNMKLHRITGAGLQDAIDVTVIMENVSSVPSGGTQATYGGNVNYANSAGSATDSSKLPTSGGTLTGNVTLTETKNILLRPGNSSYTSGIGYDTKGNECIALWAKNPVTRLRWYAGKDMSNLTAGSMMDIQPDFEISNAIGYIRGKRIALQYDGSMLSRYEGSYISQDTVGINIELEVGTYLLATFEYSETKNVLRGYHLYMVCNPGLTSAGVQQTISMTKICATTNAGVAITTPANKNYFNLRCSGTDYTVLYDLYSLNY